MGAMELEEKTVQIRDDFDPDKILGSGQCFRPRKQAEGWYRFVSGRQLLYLRPLRSGTYTVRCEPGAWETFWHGYFDLGRSYAALRGKLDSRDDFLQRAMEYGRGIRVLRQDEWEMLVSFIISQRKSIPAIRRAVELLSERFGERLGSDSEGPVYTFPTAEALCCAGEQALQECGLGYRTRYVLHAPSLPESKRDKVFLPDPPSFISPRPNTFPAQFLNWKISFPSVIYIPFASVTVLLPRIFSSPTNVPFLEPRS